jgi:hypothetical protein
MCGVPAISVSAGLPNHQQLSGFGEISQRASHPSIQGGAVFALHIGVISAKNALARTIPL